MTPQHHFVGTIPVYTGAWLDIAVSGRFTHPMDTVLTHTLMSRFTDVFTVVDLTPDVRALVFQLLGDTSITGLSALSLYAGLVAGAQTLPTLATWATLDPVEAFVYLTNADKEFVSRFGAIPVDILHPDEATAPNRWEAYDAIASHMKVRTHDLTRFHIARGQENSYPETILTNVPAPLALLASTMSLPVAHATCGCRGFSATFGALLGVSDDIEGAYVRDHLIPVFIAAYAGISASLVEQMIDNLPTTRPLLP